MRIPRSWLSEFVPFTGATAELSSLLTMGVAEVDAIDEMEGEDILVLSLKPDRGDCLSVQGIAREVAALADLPLIPRHAGVVPGSLASGANQALRLVEAPAREGLGPNAVNLFIQDPELCPRYVGIVLDGVRVGPSPEWLQRRIRQLNLRPVNNVVDVTNYVLFETGQPLHAFDLDRLRGPSIIVRRAAPGETMVLINGHEYTLDTERLVIADAEGPVAIAGVMGGLETEVSDGTTRILLESAHFNAISVRRTRRFLDAQAEIKSDAAYRFERGVDPDGCMAAASRASEMLMEIAGASQQGALDLYPLPPEPRSVRVRTRRVRSILGMDLDEAVIQDTMRRLDLPYQPDSEGLTVFPPTRRPDLAIEEDLVEEVARIVGYAKVPTTLPVASSTPGGLIHQRRLEETLRDTLVGSGCTEIRSYSLTNADALQKFGDPTPCAAIRNPTSADRNLLRPSVLPSVLEAAAANLRYGFRNLHLFEIGHAFRAVEGESRPIEEPFLAGVAMGTALESAWNLDENEAASDFYAVRGVLDNVASALRLSFSVTPLTDHPSLHPGRAGQVVLNGSPVGILGELHPEVAARYELPNRPIVFQLAVSPLLEAHRKEANRPIALDLYRQPPATRDLALVVKADVPYAEVIDAVKAASPLVTAARLFDVYRGPGIAADEKSIAISLVLRAPGRTLKDQEANDCVDGIVHALGEKLGARRR